MSKKLLDQMARPVFNVSDALDITTGKFDVVDIPTNEELFGGTNRFIGFNSGIGYNPHLTGRSMMMHNLLEEGVRETKGGTIERFKYAVGLFKYMGFMVEWDGTLNHPKVSWIDTEGWFTDWDVPAFIKSKLMDDVEEKPVDVKLHEHFHQQVSNLRDSAKHRIDFTIDSITEMD